MCLKNKIIAIGLCALIVGMGIFSANSSVAMTQASGTSTMTMEQMQQLILKLQEQITYVTQLLLAQNKPVCGDGKCAVTENTTNCAKDCKCVVAGEKTENESVTCCSGLIKETINPCGNVPCSSVLLYTCKKPVVTPSIAPKIICSTNADCVSDGGTCHKCLNRVWFKEQVAANGGSPFLCDGIGNSICQCKSGNCTSVAICGDGTCNATYENGTNCLGDCGPVPMPESMPESIAPKTNCSTNADCVSACTLKNNGCSYSGGFMTFDCSDHGGGNFVAAGCNSRCEPYGKCYRVDGTVISVP